MKFKIQKSVKKTYVGGISGSRHTATSTIGLNLKKKCISSPVFSYLHPFSNFYCLLLSSSLARKSVFNMQLKVIQNLSLYLCLWWARYCNHWSMKKERENSFTTQHKSFNSLANCELCSCSAITFFKLKIFTIKFLKLPFSPWSEDRIEPICWNVQS